MLYIPTFVPVLFKLYPIYICHIKPVFLLELYGIRIEKYTEFYVMINKKKRSTESATLVCSKKTNNNY